MVDVVFFDQHGTIAYELLSRKAAPTILNIVKNALGLFAQGENVFRGTTCIQSLALHFVSTDILCSCNVELTLKPTWHVCPDFWIGLEMRLGSLLEGYFYNSFAEARTDRFLSVLFGVVYSSLSWHLADR